MYNCTCDDCKAQQTTFNLALSDKFKQLLNVGAKAFKHLHKLGKYSPEDLKTQKPYQNLIKSTFDIFNFAVEDNDMPEGMQRALQSDAYLFGSLKANAQLFEASKLLLNDDGRLKPFSEVSKVFDKLNVNYNQNYLEAEYEFAVASSQMAAKWSELGSAERYNLQYRTAKDERVRESHQALADITLPKEDAFWSSFYPPNGWRCRCTAVEVLKDKYDVSNSETAIKAGEKATTEIGKDGKNRLEIFRFNPGQQKVVFPPTHPYNKVKGANATKQNINKKDEENIYKLFNTNKNETSEMSFHKKALAINSKILEHESLSINKYTGSFYDQINTYLRNGKKPSDELYNSYINIASKGLNKLKSFEGDVYRGSGLNEAAFNTYVKALNNGKPVIEKAFFSTSKDITKKFDKNTIYKIKSKTGKLVEELSEYQSEQEVLFKPNTKFKIISAIKNDFGFEIEMEEI